MRIIYLGYNSFKTYKRGVENVIDFQSESYDFERIYYIHWGAKTEVYKNKRFTCIAVKNCWYWPVILNYILIRIKNNGKYIIHSHNPLFSFTSIFKTDILTVHDGLYYLNKEKGKKLNALFFVIEKIVYSRTSIVHFISNFTKEKSLFGNRKNFVIIPNTSHFENCILPKNLKTETTKNILIVRSIEKRARIDLVLSVAEKLYNKDISLTIAGKGPLLEHFQHEIEKKELNNIEMLGYVPDYILLNLYARCDIVLVTAEYGEGFGLPIIEGYLFNKPVIASNQCAIPEVIFSKDYLFDNTAESIINTIDFVLNNSDTNFRNFYDLNFSNSQVMKKIRNLYMSSIQ